MKKLYWQSLEINQQTFYFTVTDKGLNFVSSPHRHISELFDFYPHDRYTYQFMYDENVTGLYLDEFNEFFDKKRQSFDVPLDLSGITNQLELKVIDALREIPYGETVTYKQLAENIGKPKAIRAVASAVAKNPFLIVVPCHRVVKANGEIGEYRGDTDTKKALLEFEKTPLEKQPLIKKIPLPKLSQLGRPGL
jgi:methylated-DNA-[protein]-cysteine S-methyltransferase